MPSVRATLRADIDKELHDLCGPITLLSCRLELGQMMGDPDSLKNAVDGALTQCRETFERIASMRRRLHEICAEPDRE